MAHLHQNNRAGIRNRFSPDGLDQEAHCVDIAVHGCKVQRGVSPTVCRLHVCTRLEHSTRTKKKAFGSQRKEHPECSRKTRNRPFSFSSFQTQLKLKATVCPGHRRPCPVKRLQHVYVSFGGCQVGRSRGIEVIGCHIQVNTNLTEAGVQGALCRREQPPGGGGGHIQNLVEEPQHRRMVVNCGNLRRRKRSEGTGQFGPQIGPRLGTKLQKQRDRGSALSQPFSCSCKHCF